jgi:seryl-tRNA synthetase
MVAILENYQNKDGSVIIPKVLQKYMGKKKISVQKKKVKNKNPNKLAKKSKKKK